MRSARLALMSGCLSAGTACGFGGAVLSRASGVDAMAQGSAYGLSSGQAATCALQGGVASCWGANGQGTLGTGDQVDRTSPTLVRTATRFAAVAVGEFHVCGVDATLSVVECWGGNGSGQLGLGDNAPRTSPAPVGLGLGALDVTAGYDFTCAILADRSLWCWGDNTEGQLGQSDMQGAPNAAVPRQTGTMASWMHVSGGQGHACAIQEPGTLWCWGRNTAGQLGLGPNLPVQVRTPTQVGSDVDWATLDLGQDAACATKHDGTMWCWGDDEFSQLGLSPGPDAGSTRALVPTRSGSDSDWAQVSVDTFHGCAVKTGGTLWCWGRNVEGQLGLGDTQDRGSPTQVGMDTDWILVSAGRFHTCAETSGHAVYCTGANDTGQLGVSDTNRRNAFTQVALP